MANVRKLIHKLIGQQHLISHQEIMLTSVIALIAMALVTWISSRVLSHSAAPYIVASMGASTVLLVAIPSSPMNRTWPLLGSHLISAFIGVSCVLYLSNLLYAIPIAVAGSLLSMHYLRCLHPPGGATAMLTVLAGPEVIQLGYQFVLTPVLLNVLVLLVTVRGIHLLLQAGQQREHYISPLKLNRIPQPITLKPHFDKIDLQTALKQLDTFIDVEDDELMRLYSMANHHHHQRHLGDLRCSDLMLPSPVAAEFGTSLEEAWHWLGKYQLTALPVINRAKHVIGIITLDDFIEHAQKLPQATLEQQIEALIKATPELTSEKPEVVGQIMAYPVITAPESARVAELLPILDKQKIHHLPIINDNAKLVGVLSRNQISSLFQDKVNSL